MVRYISIFSVLACTFLLVACSSSGPAKKISKFSNDTPQIAAAPDSVSAMLADAADRASNALETLAAVEHYRAPGANLSPIDNAPVKLRRAVTVNWIGPVETITKTLADRASYSFQAIGTPPPVPVVVSIDAENKPVIDVLRDIGLQLGQRGDVKVDSNRNMVEIHYPPTTGVGG